MTKEQRKIIKEMSHRILSGEAGVIFNQVKGERIYSNNCKWEVTVGGREYQVTIFIDGMIENGDYDYVAEIEFPDGSVVEFDELMDEGLDFIGQKNDDTGYSFDDIDKVKECFTKAYYDREWGNK